MRSVADRYAARVKRLLRLGTVPVIAVQAFEAPPEYALHPTVCRALDAATFHERAGSDERRPRTVVSVPGSQPFLAGNAAATADALRVRFPKELASPSQAEVAARHLAQVVRQRARARKAGTSWATNW